MLTEKQIYTNSKKLPKEYQILNLRMILNKELYEEKIISFDIFEKMQKLLLQKMAKINSEYKKD